MTTTQRMELNLQGALSQEWYDVEIAVKPEIKRVPNVHDPLVCCEWVRRYITIPGFNTNPATSASFLSRGGQAEIWRDFVDGRSIVLKCYKNCNYKEAQRELDAFKQIQVHPHIIDFFGVQQKSKSIELRLEYAPMGDLMEYLTKHPSGVTEARARLFTKQIVQAIEHCHEIAHIAHLDLKLENVLLINDSHVKLADFGLSSGIHGQCTNMGSFSYSCPEMIAGQSFDLSKADIWSIGVIVFVLLVGFLPYEQASNKDWRFLRLDSRKCSSFASQIFLLYDMNPRIVGHAATLINSLMTCERSRPHARHVLLSAWLQ